MQKRSLFCARKWPHQRIPIFNKLPPAILGGGSSPREFISAISAARVLFRPKLAELGTASTGNSGLNRHAPTFRPEFQNFHRLIERNFQWLGPRACPAGEARGRLAFGIFASTAEVATAVPKTLPTPFDTAQGDPNPSAIEVLAVLKSSTTTLPGRKETVSARHPYCTLQDSVCFCFLLDFSHRLAVRSLVLSCLKATVDGEIVDE